MESRWTTKKYWSVEMSIFFNGHIEGKLTPKSKGLELFLTNVVTLPQCETQTIRLSLPLAFKCFFLRLEFLRIYLGWKKCQLRNTWRRTNTFRILQLTIVKCHIWNNSCVEALSLFESRLIFLLAFFAQSPSLRHFKALNSTAIKVIPAITVIL